jgi:uncharacterized repeat protein (TIGR01451 family)
MIGWNKACAASLRLFLVAASIIATCVLAPSSAGAQDLDVLIDGNGDGIYGVPGSGAGGFSVRESPSPGVTIFTLEIQNQGTKKNKYWISWNQIPPLNATINGITSLFQTDNVEPGASVFYSFQVQVPPGVIPGDYNYIIDVLEIKFRIKERESVRATVTVHEPSQAVIMGVVFNDSSHDGLYTAGEQGIGGVSVMEMVGGTRASTSADGSFGFVVPAGVPVSIAENNLSGYLSLSPDTLGPYVLSEGDTISISFADVPPIRLTPGVILNGLAGSYVDFPHTLQAGTSGQVFLNVVEDGGAVTMLIYDANGNGLFDDGDRTLKPGDCDLDPGGGSSRVAFLVRVFIPFDKQPGEELHVHVEATQQISGTGFVFADEAWDVALVVGNAVGRLTLGKETDKATAVPGDIITYTVSFFNAGIDTIQNVVLLDPVSDYVDVLPDGFGPGQDVEWQLEGQAARYLTIDPSDGDECEYNPAENLLRVVFSKSSPIYILPGQSGIVAYKVIVK